MVTREKNMFVCVCVFPPFETEEFLLYSFKNL